MISKNVLISKLSPFMGKKEILIHNQDAYDIISGILRNHDKYKSEYDKIYFYFLGNNLNDTCYNIWRFLKNNFNYTIESEKKQIVRSASAILASDKIGIDCKGYATFANGVMSAIKRNTGANFDVIYRFASYNPYEKTPEHVFSVIKTANKEYWIDPVLDAYNNKKNPYFYKDKKVNDMALIAMSGYNDNYNRKADFIGYKSKMSGVDLYGGDNPNINYTGSDAPPPKSNSSILDTFATKGASAAEDILVPGAGEVLNALGINDIFSKAGVKPSFFQTFAFLSFLDNSTNHWKSRVAKMKNWTPNQILAYYVDLANKANGDTQDIKQFFELYLDENHGHSFQYNIAPLLDFNAAEVYNTIIEKRLFSNNANNWTDRQGHIYTKSQLTIPLNQTKGYNPLNSIFSTASGAGLTAGVSGFAIIGLIGAALYFFTRKKR